jgi:DNA-binding LacI/PurR family transcriptional regulator
MRSSKKAGAPVLESRLSACLAGTLRAGIEKGELAGGGFLPSERELARTHGVSNRTVRRALKLLAAEALISPESRRGYRVLSRANDPDRGFPLAFVVSNRPTQGDAAFYGSLLEALQDAAGRRGWSLLGVQREGRTVGEVVDHLRAARACGAVVDTLDSELLEEVRRLGIPVVMADCWLPELRWDAVVQDGFSGGILAAEWLARRGHRRVAFFGPALSGADMLVVERYSGALGGLARMGLGHESCLVAEARQGDISEAVRSAKELLSRADWPTGVLALWQGLGMAVARAARELGLALGKDLDLVGWSVSEGASARTIEDFDGLGVPAAVVWSPVEMAELCITRLMQRRADAQLPASLSRVQVRLRLNVGHSEEA